MGKRRQKKTTKKQQQKKKKKKQTRKNKQGEENNSKNIITTQNEEVPKEQEEEYGQKKIVREKRRIPTGRLSVEPGKIPGQQDEEEEKEEPEGQQDKEEEKPIKQSDLDLQSDLKRKKEKKLIEEQIKERDQKLKNKIIEQKKTDLKSDIERENKNKLIEEQIKLRDLDREKEQTRIKEQIEQRDIERENEKNDINYQRQKYKYKDKNTQRNNKILPEGTRKKSTLPKLIKKKILPTESEIETGPEIPIITSQNNKILPEPKIYPKKTNKIQSTRNPDTTIPKLKTNDIPIKTSRLSNVRLPTFTKKNKIHLIDANTFSSTIQPINSNLFPNSKIAETIYNSRMNSKLHLFTGEFPIITSGNNFKSKKGGRKTYNKRNRLKKTKKHLKKK